MKIRLPLQVQYGKKAREHGQETYTEAKYCIRVKTHASVLFIHIV